MKPSTTSSTKNRKGKWWRPFKRMRSRRKLEKGKRQQKEDEEDEDRLDIATTEESALESSPGAQGNRHRSDSTSSDQSYPGNVVKLYSPDDKSKSSNQEECADDAEMTARIMREEAIVMEHSDTLEVALKPAGTSGGSSDPSAKSKVTSISADEVEVGLASMAKASAAAKENLVPQEDYVIRPSGFGETDGIEATSKTPEGFFFPEENSQMDSFGEERSEKHAARAPDPPGILSHSDDMDDSLEVSLEDVSQASAQESQVAQHEAETTQENEAEETDTPQQIERKSSIRSALEEMSEDIQDEMSLLSENRSVLIVAATADKETTCIPVYAPKEESDSDDGVPSIKKADTFSPSLTEEPPAPMRKTNSAPPRRRKTLARRKRHRKSRLPSFRKTPGLPPIPQVPKVDSEDTLSVTYVEPGMILNVVPLVRDDGTVDETSVEISDRSPNGPNGDKYLPMITDLALPGPRKTTTSDKLAKLSEPADEPVEFQDDSSDDGKKPSLAKTKAKLEPKPILRRNTKDWSSTLVTSRERSKEHHAGNEPTTEESDSDSYASQIRDSGSYSDGEYEFESLGDIGNEISEMAEEIRRVGPSVIMEWLDLRPHHHS